MSASAILVLAGTCIALRSDRTSRLLLWERLKGQKLDRFTHTTTVKRVQCNVSKRLTENRQPCFFITSDGHVSFITRGFDMNTPTKGSVRTMDAAFQKLLDADTHPENISDALKRNAPMAPGPTLVPVKRYTSRVYH